MPGTVTDLTTIITQADAADAAAWDDIGGGQGSSQSTDVPIINETRARRVDANIRGFSFDNAANIALSAAGMHVCFVIKAFQFTLIGANGIECLVSNSGTNAASTPFDGHRYLAADYFETKGFASPWVDLSRTPENSAGALNLANTRNYGAQFDMGNVGGNAPNCHIQKIFYSTQGLQLNAGTSGDPATLADLVTYDSTNVTRIIDDDFLNGPLIIGGANSHFEDANFLLKAGQQPLAATDWIKITFDLTSATSVNVIPFAVIQGFGLVISGNAGSLDLGTMVIAEAPAQTFNDAVTWGGKLTNSAPLTWGGANLDGATIENPTGVGLIADVAENYNTKLANMTFISKGAGHGMEIQDGTITTKNFTNVTWVGFGADDTADAAINYTGATPITIAWSGGNKPTANPTSLVTVLDLTVTFTFNVLWGGTPPADYEYRIYVNDPAPGIIGTVELQGAENETDNTINYPYTYASDQNARVQIIADGYKEGLTPIIVLSNTDQSRDIEMDVDPNI